MDAIDDSPLSAAREKDLEYAKEFWTLGNVVTGFAALQSLTFLIQVGPHKGDLYCAVSVSECFSRVLISTGLVLYLSALWFCHHKRNELLTGHNALSDRLRSAFKWWIYGQTFVIVLFCVVSFAATFPSPNIRSDCDQSDTHHAPSSRQDDTALPRKERSTGPHLASMRWVGWLVCRVRTSASIGRGEFDGIRGARRYASVGFFCTNASGTRHCGNLINRSILIAVASLHRRPRPIALRFPPWYSSSDWGREGNRHFPSLIESRRFAGGSTDARRSCYRLGSSRAASGRRPRPCK